MDDERQTDHTDDPRDQDVAQGGYPETNPAGSDPGAGGGGADRSGGDVDSDAPSPSSDKEADREHSTGNPGAAG